MLSAEAKRQSRILGARYLDCMLGDFKTVVLLVAQAPLIGWLCTLVWGSIERDTPTLYFVLSLSAVWFGCINACREIVKERAILERERFFGLSLSAYVLSKGKVLAGLGLVQVVLLQLAVEWKLALKGPLLLQLCALFLASLAGTGLGLIVSALSSRQERAVGAVPLLILPQILFSKVSVPEEHFDDVVKVVEKLMPVRWAFRVYEEGAATEPDWLMAALCLVVLLGMAVLLVGGAILALVPRRET